jgi:periplasmic copper chaperone A
MIRSFLAATAATLAFALPAAADDGVLIEQAYARASAHSGAVFMVIANHSAVDDRLVLVSTDAAKLAELHTHKEDANGVMQMMAVPEGLVIPAEGEHALARGGDHIMLMGLSNPLKAGDTVHLTLTFEHAGVVEVDVPVESDR